MDTILDNYIQDYLHSDKFINMLEYLLQNIVSQQIVSEKEDCIRVQNF